MAPVPGYVHCTVVFSLLVVGSVICADDTTSNQTECDQVTVFHSIRHRSIDGVYKLQPYQHDCYNRSVYQQTSTRKNRFLYFIDRGWKGWMIGDNVCKNKGYVSATGDSETIRDVPSGIWEEFDGFRWVFNPTMIIGCLGEVDYSPIKTKTPKPDNTTSPATTTADIGEGSQSVRLTTAKTSTPSHNPNGVTKFQAVAVSSVATPGYIIILLYVITPIGCLVILVLVIVVILLYVKKPPRKMVPPEPRRRLDSEMSVRFDNIMSRAQLQYNQEATGGESAAVGGAVDVDDVTTPPEGVYDYLEQCTTGSTGRARGASFSSYGDKFGSWSSSRGLVKK